MFLFVSFLWTKIFFCPQAWHFITVPHHRDHNFRKAAHILNMSIVRGQVQVLALTCLRDTMILWSTQAPWTLSWPTSATGAHLCCLAPRVWSPHGQAGVLGQPDTPLTPPNMSGSYHCSGLSRPVMKVPKRESCSPGSSHPPGEGKQYQLWFHIQNPLSFMIIIIHSMLSIIFSHSHSGEYTFLNNSFLTLKYPGLCFLVT